MDDQQPAIRISESRIRTVCLVVLTVVALGAALYWLRPVLVPFVLALFFVTGIAPVLNLIETWLTGMRFKAPRLVAVVVTFLLGVGLLALLWLLMWASVVSLLDNVGTYKERLGEMARWVERWIPGDVVPGGAAPSAAPEKNEASPSGANTQAPDETNGELSADPNAQPSSEAKSEPKSQPPAAGASNALSNYLGRNVGTWLSQLSGALMDLLSSALIVLIFMFFLLLGDASDAVPRKGVWKEIESSIRNYIVAKTLISLVTGAAFGFVLWLFGVPLALVFGLLAFLLNFIPNIGPVIASLLPLPLILLHPELSAASMVAVIALTCGIQFVSGNIVEPKIMGESFELHPVAILLSLILWGMIWGIVGMFLAVPITAAIKILLEKFDQTRPVAELLAGRMDALNRFGERAEAGNAS